MWNQIKTTVLLAALGGVMLTIGWLFGGTTGLTIAFIIALLTNGLTYFFSDKLVLAMYRAREAKKNEYPALHKMVEGIAKKAGIPKPKLYIIPTETPNAFATGRSPEHAAVACTEGIMKLLSEKELEGVLAHELSHVKNRDMLVGTIAATIATVISYLAMMARFAALFGGGRDDNRGGGQLLGIIVLTILAPLIAVILQLAISRSREYLADETGARTIKNPHALASALKKLEMGVKAHPLRHGNATTSSLFIVNPFSAAGIAGLFSTHPPMHERIRRLENMKV